MFWASLIFMIFPILPVVTGELPVWHLLIDILFVVAYLGVLITKNQRLSWLFWGIMLVYVAGYTAFVAVNYIWFFFFGIGLVSAIALVIYGKVTRKIDGAKAADI